MDLYISQTRTSSNRIQSNKWRNNTCKEVGKAIINEKISEKQKELLQEKAIRLIEQSYSDKTCKENAILDINNPIFTETTL